MHSTSHDGHSDHDSPVAAGPSGALSAGPAGVVPGYTGTRPLFTIKRPLPIIGRLLLFAMKLPVDRRT